MRRRIVIGLALFVAVAGLTCAPRDETLANSRCVQSSDGNAESRDLPALQQVFRPAECLVKVLQKHADLDISLDRNTDVQYRSSE